MAFSIFAYVDSALTGKWEQAKWNSSNSSSMAKEAD